jgi:hypothetical protein
MARVYKRKIVIYVIFYTIILLPLILWLFWLFTPRKELKVLIYDKTVLKPKGVEHRGFNWILKNFKYVKEDRKFYRVDKDYVGFFPKKDEKYEIHDLCLYKEEEIDKLASYYDMTYYTDMYGIYREEWNLQQEYTEHSPKIYGGMCYNDYLFLKKLKEKGKLIIGEFNFIHHPTPYYIRRNVEELLGFKWTGWTARYFDSFDTIKNLELPKWVVRLYRQQNNNTWPFTKDGIVFVHENSTICIVENETHLDYPLPVIKTTEYGMNKYKIPEEINYPFWIDITFPTEVNTTIASYNIYPNEKGDSILKRFGIPLVFPAFFEHEGNYKFYYFAGDFVDSDIKFGFIYFKWADFIQKYIYNKKKLNQRYYFNWNYYTPIVKKILKDYYNEIKEDKPQR